MKAGAGVSCLERFDGSEWVAIPWVQGKHDVFLALKCVRPGETFNADRLKADMFEYDFARENTVSNMINRQNSRNIIFTGDTGR